MRTVKESKSFRSETTKLEKTAQTYVEWFYFVLSCSETKLSDKFFHSKSSFEATLSWCINLIWSELEKFKRKWCHRQIWVFLFSQIFWYYSETTKFFVILIIKIYFFIFKFVLSSLLFHSRSFMFYNPQVHHGSVKQQISV